MSVAAPGFGMKAIWDGVADTSLDNADAPTAFLASTLK
jgi:hypothetical protein